MRAPASPSRNVTIVTVSRTRAWLWLLAAAVVVALLAMATNVTTTSQLAGNDQGFAALRKTVGKLASAGVLWAGVAVLGGWLARRPGPAVLAGTAGLLTALGRALWHGGPDGPDAMGHLIEQSGMVRRRARHGTASGMDRGLGSPPRLVGPSRASRPAGGRGDRAVLRWVAVVEGRNLGQPRLRRRGQLRDDRGRRRSGVPHRRPPKTYPPSSRT